MRDPELAPKNACLLFGFLLFGLALGCKDKNPTKRIILPDVRSSFARQLLSRDSTLILDSFELVGIDTLTQQSGLIHQRYPFLRTMRRLTRESDSMSKAVATQKIPLKDDLDRITTLHDELAYLHHVLDSLNAALRTADSITPIGYRAVYKVSLHKPGEFSIADSIAYAIDREKLADWEGNVSKDIDSLAVGRHPRSVNYRRRP
ncbi:MAG TPA: hypothetical protein VHE34_06535 [Puia sp.]|uniref:hypothetical protein n=1 Tax=Puia sp. TaxID=2045100 RepID=UPI002CAA0CC5|nr:hypothetical protein [Puia sp.]HVU94862.1 hypothetical protein [Puia sp.]